MTFDPTKPCITRSGDSVTILSTEMYGKKSIAAVIGQGKAQKLHRYFNCGQLYLRGKDHRDLINAPEKRWVNIYDVDHLHAEFHYSRVSADECATDKRLACLSFIDGDGLDGETP